MQWCYWYRNVWFKHVEIRQKIVQESWYIYNIGYVTIKTIGSGYDINGLNPLYLRINNVSAYIGEINKDKYSAFDDTYENKELLKDMMMFLMELWVKLKK